ncbi:hypothetical protein LTR17_025349 [Elasticomyces elasticus]|nr:hypothetical protein LTR17_025349 [Elasticomyces elasticus]
MRSTSLLTGLSCVILASAAPTTANDVNPFIGKSYYANSPYAAKLEQTVQSFLAEGDELNAARTRTAQRTGTFVWISSIGDIPDIDTAIKEAREAKRTTGKEQIVELVLYNLPDRDCSAGESAGELTIVANGLERYKSEFVDPFAKAVQKGSDLTFAIVLEPDSLGNVVTNQGIPKCATAGPVYEEGIAYAISQLQKKNVALYVDAAHGGWLGWDGNLEPGKIIKSSKCWESRWADTVMLLAAQEFAKVVRMAQNLTKKATIRGFSINVSNYNPYVATVREPYDEYNNAYDNSHYATVLSPHLIANGLPAHFIVDQGRVAEPGARAAWGDWCNISPAGFGHVPTADASYLNNANVDSIVWIKPGGESDGACGLAGAPDAGLWFDEYAQMLVENADPSFSPSQADVAVFKAISTAPKVTNYPHAARWYKHIVSYSDEFATLPGDAAKPYTAYGPDIVAATLNPAKDPAAEDEIDLFGSDEEEEDANAARVREERLAEYRKKKEAKPKVAAKSVVILDVKPWDDQTNMAALKGAVRGIEKEGLV